ncbi:MAG: hypothetical protein HYV40_00775 [Candidatus Levybacteria bacterium]|nr:hypothetical protein [Candidatus Levybacteria bacterium]
MITILHGDNITASRNEFIKRKQAAGSPIMLRGGTFTITDLVQVFEGGELFQESKNIFLEDLFARVKKGQELTSYTDYISSQGKEHDITLWEGKQLTKTQLSSIPQAQTLLYKVPSTLFTFLDELKPGNTKRLIILAQQAKHDVGEEMLLAMLVRLIRQLLALKEHAEIEEVKKLAPWQKSKLQTQAAHFTTEQLLRLHERLFLLDKKRKTGTNDLSLPASIDFFLLQL